MSSKRLLPFAILVLVALAAQVLFDAQSTRLAVPSTRSALQRVRWGVFLETDRPFYAPGDVARVEFRLSNGSTQDAFGWSGVGGGNGCSFRVALEDAAGREVWLPGSVQNGTYQAPGCSFGVRFWSLLGGSDLTTPLDLPLVYQNPSGIGVLGAALSPGFYRVVLDFHFTGPHDHVPNPELDFGGMDFSASVPIQIL